MTDPHLLATSTSHAAASPHPNPSPLATARSFLFVPADRPDRLLKALASAADFVIADLEDAVAPERKAAARADLSSAWEALAPASRARLLVRVNGWGHPDHEADLAAVGRHARAGLAGVMIPKSEDGRRLAEAASACPGLPLIALVESAQAFAGLDAIAAAPQVVRLAFGHLDLQADLGMQAGADQTELLPARWAVAAASRRAGLAPPIDGVTPDIADPAQLGADVRRALRLGFTAKLCIHPAQIAAAHAALAPSPAECTWAQRVLDAAEASGGAAVQVDGRMVDAPVIRLATQLLARARD
jgi:citrate lyase subunit beta/citryl-CoA lyase